MPEATVKLNRIQFAMELARSGMKLGEVAAKSGLRRETLSRARNGSMIRMSTLEKLAEVFSIPAAQLMEGKGDC